MIVPSCPFIDSVCLKLHSISFVLFFVSRPGSVPHFLLSSLSVPPSVLLYSCLSVSVAYRSKCSSICTRLSLSVLFVPGSFSFILVSPFLFFFVLASFCPSLFLSILACSCFSLPNPVYPLSVFVYPLVFQ